MNKSKEKKCESGGSPNADTALIGCLLMKAGICGKEKEEIKEEVFKIIIANRENATKESEKKIEKALQKAKTQKFPRGERKWCIECANRITKVIKNNLKQF